MARSPSAPFSGTSRFELRRLLGQGGFGVVYEAFDRERARPVALKHLRYAEGEYLSQFKDEFRLLRDVSHDNLVTLEELHTDGPHWFFTMELIAGGETILSYTRPHRSAGDGRPGHGALDPSRLRHALPQLTGALMTLHRHGIVHRDIKPSNVLVAPDGRVVVLDFGLIWAKERDGSVRDEEAELSGLRVLGTAAYMAPEQASPSGASAAADWYSVGVVLYEALTGRRPFDGDARTQLERKQTERPDPPHVIAPDVSREWSDVCAGLLEPDPRDRLTGRALVNVFGPAPEPKVEVVAEDDLLGRDTHLDALADAFAATQAGGAVVALVSGRSGMGKTALVRRFLADQRDCEPALVTLRGRCYERESMPYKAIDPIIDSLSRYLRRLPYAELAELLPRDAAILTRVFPALLEMDAFANARDPGMAGMDSATLRQRAATALRELLQRITIAVPLIVWIDDAQWGDADSAAFLQYVLSPPDPPRLLLIAAYRAEDAPDAPLVAALSRLVGERGGPGHCAIDVAPLSLEEATFLAGRLAGPQLRRETLTESIARESGGSPFFVHELARHAATLGTATRLEVVVQDRVESLPDSTRHVMSVVALSAQSIPPAVAEAAAAIGDHERSVIHVLAASRLVRARAGASEHTLEPYHDRIREAVVSRLSADELVTWHGRLAEAWERSGRARPDTLATHYASAGNASRASLFAEKAADLARHALAFDRAAEFYRLLLRLDAQPERRREWLIALGDALVNDGRGKEAADSFHDALKLTKADDAIELESRAAAELIRAGYLNEAMAALGELLPKVQVRAPASDRQAVLTLLLYRVLIGMRGIGVREQPESRVPRDLLQRIDVLVAIGAPLSLIALPRGLSLNMQATWHALRAGERKRAALGLALLAATSSMRGTRAERSSMRFVAAAKALAAPLADDYTTARTLLAEGICLKVTGHWSTAIERLQQAIALFIRCPGSRWEIETAQTLIHDSLIWTGDWRRLASELPARRYEAEQRGDRYAGAHAAGRISPLISLVADQPARAHAEAEAAARHSSQPHYNLQARAALCAWLDIDLYQREPARAAARLQASWPSLRGTLALFQSGRIEVLSYQGRVALARIAAGDRLELKTASDAAAKLEKEQARWATALAALIRAGIAQATQDPSVTAPLLERAQQQLATSGMQLYAAAVAYRRGQLAQGETGGELMADALSTLRRENVVDPVRMVEVLCPGPWPPAGAASSRQ